MWVTRSRTFSWPSASASGSVNFGRYARDRRLEVEGALLDEHHQRGSREGLGGRADLEQRVLVDVERELHAGHAVGEVVLVAVQEHADRGAGHREPVHRLLDDRPEPALEVGGHQVVPSVWVTAQSATRRQ